MYESMLVGKTHVRHHFIIPIMVGLDSRRDEMAVANFKWKIFKKLRLRGQCLKHKAIVLILLNVMI